MGEFLEPLWPSAAKPKWRDAAYCTGFCRWPHPNVTGRQKGSWYAGDRRVHHAEHTFWTQTVVALGQLYGTELLNLPWEASLASLPLSVSEATPAFWTLLNFWCPEHVSAVVWGLLLYEADRPHRPQRGAWSANGGGLHGNGAHLGQEG